jgi:hypothetical protein
MKISLRSAALVLAFGWGTVACSSASGSSTDAGSSQDATGQDVTSPGQDAGPDALANGDAPGGDSAESDAGPTVTGFSIATVSGQPLQAAAGDSLALKVVATLSDGTMMDLDPTQVTWTSPQTISAQNPNDAGSSVLPSTGAQPTAFFVQNAFRPDRSDYPGLLFVIDPGTAAGGTLMVTASVPEGGTVSATIPVTPTPAGNPDAGADLYYSQLNCAMCHGDTGGGSPPTTLADGGIVYILMGGAYPYPAPAINNTMPGGMPAVAADPNWNAALMAFASLADMDNSGVALRPPMPDQSQSIANGKPVGAQEFAHIYAFLKTQTK